MYSSFFRYLTCLLYILVPFSLHAQSSSVGIAAVPQNPLGQLTNAGNPALSWDKAPGHGSQAGLHTPATINLATFDHEFGTDQPNWNYGDPQEYRESYVDRNTLHFSSYGVDMIFSNEANGPDEYGSVFCLVEFAHTPFAFWPGPLGGIGDKAKFDQMHYFNADQGEGIDMIDLSPLGVTHPDQVQWYEGNSGYPYSYLLIDDNDGDMDDVAAAVLFRFDRTFGTFSKTNNIIYAEGQTTYSVYRRAVGQSSYTLIADGLTDAEYVDQSLVQPQGVFEYVITAHDMFGESTYSEPVTIGGASVFPVEWLGFSVERVDAQATELVWATAKETRNERFDVERSMDGLSFSAVGSVAGSGTTSESRQYTFTDQEAPTEQVYYRIRQVDLDGQSSYSETVTVQALEEDGLFLLKAGPNPAQEYLRIQGYPRDRNLALRVVDIQGRTWLAGEVRPADAYPYQLDLGKMPTGLYVLFLEDEEEESRTSMMFLRQ